MLKTLQSKLETVKNQAKVFYAELEAKGDKVTAEDRNKFTGMLDEGKSLVEQIEKMRLIEQAALKTYETPAPKTLDGVGAVKSAGELFIESESFKAAQNAPSSIQAQAKTPVKIGGVKNTIAGITGAGLNQLPVQAERISEMLGLPQAPITVLDLINVSRTNSNMVEWVRHLTRTLNAAETAEGAAKPQSDLTFDVVQSPVLTIAHYLTETRQILGDEPRLRDLIDSELLYGLNLRLAGQVVNGAGTGGTLTGILNTAGIQTRTKNGTTPVGRDQLTTTSLLDTFRLAITDIQLEFFEPDAILCNPIQAEKFELEKDSQGRYLAVFDPVTLRLWRTRVVTDTRITNGTALVGAFRQGATLWMREDAEIMVGQPNDHFRKNLIDVLAELRAAFAVKHAKAFEKITIS